MLWEDGWKLIVTLATVVAASPNLPLPRLGFKQQDGKQDSRETQELKQELEAETSEEHCLPAHSQAYACPAFLCSHQSPA